MPATHLLTIAALAILGAALSTAGAMGGLRGNTDEGREVGCTHGVMWVPVLGVILRLVRPGSCGRRAPWWFAAVPLFGGLLGGGFAHEVYGWVADGIPVIVPTFSAFGVLPLAFVLAYTLTHRPAEPR